MGRAVPVDADPADLPEVLVSPPWLDRKRNRPPVLELTRVDRPVRLAWLPGEQQEWAQTRPRWVGSEAMWEEEVGNAIALPAYPLVEILADAPDHLARPHLHRLLEIEQRRRYRLHLPVRQDDPPGWSLLDPHRRLLGRFGSEVVDFELGAAASNYWYGNHLLPPFDGTEISHLMLSFLDEDKTLVAHAEAWFRRHRDTATSDLIPLALGKAVKLRRQAERVLRLLDGDGHREVILEAAAGYGDAAVATTTAVLDRDPLLFLPTRVPTAPDWLNVGSLPRIRVRGGTEVFPKSVVGHLISMLMMSAGESVYAGVPMVVVAADPVSLGEFAWMLYQLWEQESYPAKRNPWVSRALGLLGDDMVVGRLRRIAEGDRAVTRAEAALDALTQIGTHTARVAVQRVSEHTKHPYVRRSADTAIANMAAELGISVVEFADRAIPDLGLSADGARTFDYGSRRFSVELDEQVGCRVRSRSVGQTSIRPPGA
ncbi:HEAT repeat domain-containing protein [Nocardia niigatensis]|uniref:HEAT repeat domain-containing protein n=1 Tax=Nocardia niigatensis TaxID=209249 RepID=UPI000595230B|nr:HEAT repeat domain-containing protein [Nocardia niigatensis]